MRETKVEAGPVVHVSERIAIAVHDVFTVFRAELVSGEPSVGRQDDDVSDVAWVPVEEASVLMPRYPDGVVALLGVAGAGYSDARE